MQHWEVIGASRSTGEDRRVTIHAANEQQAIDWATANDLLVSSIRQVPVERPHRAGAGRTAVRGRRAGESRIVLAFDQYLTPRWLVFLWGAVRDRIDRAGPRVLAGR